MEARDASGKTIATDHVEIITAGGWMIPAFIAATVVGVAMVAGSGVFASLWARIPLIVLGALIAAVAVGSLVFAFWGMYAGFSWHFTPS